MALGAFGDSIDGFYLGKVTRSSQFVFFLVVDVVVSPASQRLKTCLAMLMCVLVIWWRAPGNAPSRPATAERVACSFAISFHSPLQAKYWHHRIPVGKGGGSISASDLAFDKTRLPQLEPRQVSRPGGGRRRATCAFFPVCQQQFWQVGVLYAQFKGASSKRKLS